MKHMLAAGAALVAVGCSASEDGGGGGGTTTPPPGGVTPVGITDAAAVRFLNQATFGAKPTDIDQLQAVGYEQWILDEFAKPQESLLQSVLLVEASGADAGRTELAETFWTRAILGDDQLRQRFGFALSQIIVASYADGALEDRPVAMANYMDIINAGAFGNYRQLIENVTYSPAMAIWLTYLQNQKADTEREVVPDENYAREIMQLFTIGLIDLQPNGDPQLDGGGNEIETYDNVDITELAKVFTGLSWAETGRFFARPDDIRSQYLPLVMYDEEHSPEAKSFLGATIPANTSGDQSIRMALDVLVDHPNTAPFVSRQLIQRLVTSNPSSAYVGRVADAFRTGAFTMPDGRVAGGGGRGDMRAVAAAILLDAEATDASLSSSVQFGKVREPVIRFTQWARAFGVASTDVSNVEQLRDTQSPNALNQQAYRSPSVFNFYRPGYVQPGSESAAAGMVAPELQITTAASVTGYANFMTDFIFNDDGRADFAPNYDAEIALAGDPAALVDHLNVLLAHGALTAETRSQIVAAIGAVTAGSGAFTRDEIRARLGVLFVMNSSDYIVQR